MAQLKFLSNDDVKRIHNATLRILNEVGYVWTHKESLEILTGAGCKVKSNRVYFPPELVEDSIQKAGKRPTIRGRGGMTKTLGDGNLYFHNLGGALPRVADAAGWQWACVLLALGPIFGTMAMGRLSRRAT